MYLAGPSPLHHCRQLSHGANGPPGALGSLLTNRRLQEAVVEHKRHNYLYACLQYQLPDAPRRVPTFFDPLRVALWIQQTGPEEVNDPVSSEHVYSLHKERDLSTRRIGQAMVMVEGVPPTSFDGYYGIIRQQALAVLARAPLAISAPSLSSAASTIPDDVSWMDEDEEEDESGSAANDDVDEKEGRDLSSDDGDDYHDENDNNDEDDDADLDPEATNRIFTILAETAPLFPKAAVESGFWRLSDGTLKM